MKDVIKEILMFCEKFEFRTTLHYAYAMNDMKRLVQDLWEVQYAD